MSSLLDPPDEAPRVGRRLPAWFYHDKYYKTRGAKDEVELQVAIAVAGGKEQKAVLTGTHTKVLHNKLKGETNNIRLRFRGT